MFVIETTYDVTSKTKWWAGVTKTGWPDVVTEKSRAKRFWTKRAANAFLDRFETLPMFMIAETIKIAPRWSLF